MLPAVLVLLRAMWAQGLIYEAAWFAHVFGPSILLVGFKSLTDANMASAASVYVPMHFFVEFLFSCFVYIHDHNLVETF